MKRWFARVLIVLLGATMPVSAPAQTLQTYDFPVPLRGVFVPPTPADAFILISQVGGAYVKSITTGGLATVQLADNTEATVQITAGGGGTLTAGTADPTGGNAGDAYLQVDASNVIQSIWRNVAGTWTEYTIPAGGGTLSDDDPENVAATASPGTSTEASRSDHVHIGDGAGTGTLSDDDPAAVAQTASPGTSAEVSRADHVHVGDGAGTGTPSDNNPENVTSGAASAGTSGEVSRSDHVHSGVPAPSATVLNTSYSAAGTAGTAATLARGDHRHGLDATDRFNDGDAPQNVTTGASASGDDTVPARRDHVHGGDSRRSLSDAVPEVVIAGTGSSGTNTTVSRSDHVHGGDANTQRTLSDSAPANIAETSSAGTNSEVSREDHVHGGAPQPADSIVAETITATGTVGSSTTEFAREDHRHGINVAGLFDNTNPANVAETAAPGTATIAARRDHVHVGATEQIQLIDSQNDVTYTQADTADLSSRFGGQAAYVADIDADGAADLEINDMIIFQWRDDPAGVPGTRALGIRINQTGETLPIRIVDPLTNALVNKTVADLTRYEFLFLSRQSGGVYIQLSTLALNAVMQRLIPAGGTAGQVLAKDTATDFDVSWTDASGGVSLSDDDPQPVGTAAAGTATTASRSDHVHGGGTASGTWLGLSDTPGAFTNAAGQFTRVNRTETALEYVPEPANTNTIPHVSRIPAVADDSPVLVFLTHDEIGGAREDATLTVGEALGQYCGYSNGDIFQAFGSINKPSPIEMIFGIWDGTDCTLQTVHSANEGFIDDIRSVIFTVAGGTETTCQLGNAFQEYGYQTKRILSCTGLEDIGTVDVTINFLYADGTTAYWTDGSRTHRAGLYEKTGTPPVYHDLAPPEDAHRTGEGSAACGDSEPPDAAGQVCVTSDGRGYFAMPRTSLVTTPATIEVAASGSGFFIPDIYEAQDLESRANLNDGNFIYIKATQEFYQFQDPDFEVVTWTEAWQYVIDNVGDTPARQVFVASTFLGEFASENEVLRDRDGYSTPIPAQGTATITGGEVTGITIDFAGSGYTTAPTITIPAPGTGTQATATATITDGAVTAITITQAGSGYAAAPEVTFSDPPGVIDYFFLYSDFGALIRITEFTNSVRETITAGFTWRGPVIIPEEVLDIVEANPVDEIDLPLDSILIGSQRYSVIVRPGSNGALRAATAADYDTTYARSKVVAVVDGRPYKVRRTLAAGHTASGTFTAVAANTSLTAGGSGTFRFRGIFDADQDVGSPEEDDIYYNIQYHHWRVRDHDPAYGNYWYTLPNGGEILTRLSWVGYYPSEIEALGHATTNGQRFVLPQGSGWALYTLSAFTAAEPDHYEYSWIEAVAVPVLPANETLIDDQALTWASANKPSVEVEFSRGLDQADDGRAVLIDYRPNAAGAESRAVGGAILVDRIRHLTTLRPVSLTKVGPGFGGRSAIDRTVDVSNSPGSVEFPFPLSSGDNDLRWMRLHYIGDHIDDIDGTFGFTTTTLTLDDVTDVRVDTNYWIVGPVSGSGCPVTSHSEKVTVTAIGTPNPNDITVIRGVDNTQISDLVNCTVYVSGADFIEDDKATFILVPSHDDQDSGDFSFTLLAQGTGGGAASGAGTVPQGGGILLQKYFHSTSTLIDVTETTWVDIFTQSITVASGTDRVLVDGLITVKATASSQECDLRVARDTTLVGSIASADIQFNNLRQLFSIREADTPGPGTYTYRVQARQGIGETDDCEVSQDSSNSSASFEVIGAN